MTEMCETKRYDGSYGRYLVMHTEVDQANHASKDQATDIEEERECFLKVHRKCVSTSERNGPFYSQ